MEQIEEPEIKPHSYIPLIFDKGTKNIHCRKESLINKWSWKTDYLYAKD
jgi:hypothetical protein